MNGILETLAQAQWQNFAIALLHTLWQGLAAAGMVYLVLLFIPKRRPNPRYLLSLFAMCGIVIGFFVTWAVLEYEPPAGYTFSDGAEQSSSILNNIYQTITIPKQFIERNPSTPSTDESAASPVSIPWTTWLLMLWGIGLMGMLARFSIALSRIEHIRQTSSELNNPQIDLYVERIKNAFRINRSIKIFINHQLSSPATFGLFESILILPASILTNTPPDYIKAVLAHEMAHIRRFDYAINLLQLLIEAVFFFNPFVWWISRQIRVEREACCDAAAIAATGETAQYLNALVHFSDARGRVSFAPSAAVSFVERKKPYLLSDRIKRLVNPAYYKSPSISWSGLSITLLYGIVAVACLKEGAELTVETISNWLITPEQMEQLVEIDQTYGPSETDYKSHDIITISGTVRMKDGTPLPDKVSLVLYSRRSNSSMWSGLTLNDNPFRHSIGYGKVYIVAELDQYATTVTGPLECDPGGEIDDIDIVFEPGYESRIRFVDPQQNPIPNVDVFVSIWLHNNTPGKTHHYTGNEDGLVSILHCNSFPRRVEVKTVGYEYDRKQFKFQPDRTETWVLHPTDVTTGVIVSGITGLPLAGAELRLMEEKGPFQMTYSTESGGPAQAITDANGQFRLGSLRNDSIYTFLVSAKGHRRDFLRTITPGQRDIQFTLGPEIVVKGKVVGETISQISYSNPYITQDGNSSSYQKLVDLDRRDDGGYFTITDLWPGHLTIYAGGQREALQIDRSIDDLVIDLGKPDEVRSATRTVEFRFEIPENSAPPEGRLDVHYLVATQEYMDLATLPIEHGLARLDVPVPGKVSYQPTATIGYWFEEKYVDPILEGDEPYVITIPAIPAGSVYGQVLHPDGTTAEQVFITPTVQRKSPLMKYDSLQLSTSPMTDAYGKFNAGPLPLGGTYRLVAHTRTTYMISDPIEITQEQPVHEIRFQLVEGASLTGRVVDENRQPVSGIEVSLSYNPPVSHSFGSGKVFTNRDGEFLFERVNANAEGEYWLNLNNRSRYQPKRVKVDFDRQPVVIQLRPGYIVTGTVVDQKTGYPIPGAEVYATRSHYSTDPEEIFVFEAEQKTDESGRFRFSNLCDGQFDLNTRSGRLLNPTTIQSTDRSTSVELKIELYEWSGLMPQKPE